MWLYLETGSCRGNYVRTESSEWVLIPYDWYLAKEVKFKDRHAHRENSVRTWRRPSTSQGERPETHPSLTALRKTLLTPWIQTSDLQICEPINLLFRPLSLCYFVTATLGKLTQHQILNASSIRHKFWFNGYSTKRSRKPEDLTKWLIYPRNSLLIPRLFLISLSLSECIQQICEYLL